MPTAHLRSSFLALALTAAAAPALAAQPAAPAAAVPKVPPIQFTQRTLKNGLKLIAIRDSSTPDVMVSMWYEVGSKHDPAGRSGFAHLFEHILSRKTENMPYNAINRMVDDIGGTRNASTSFDRTNYFETVPAEYLERMLWTHAERMARPVVDKEVFETERGVVKEELRQSVLAPPYGRLFRFALGENIYNVLPHRRPIIGSITDLDNATLEDARAFHQAYYGPDSATLIVAGNFDPGRLNELVDRYFLAIPRRARPAPLAITAKDTPVKPRTVTASGPNVPLPVVGSLYRAPASRHPDAPALEVLNAILASGDNSRLDSALVKTGLATQEVASLNFTEEQGYLAVLAYVAGGNAPEAVAAQLDQTVDRLRSAPPSAAEMTEARNELLAAALAQRETASGRAFELGESYVRTGDARAADKRLAAIARVSPADVQRVARTYLSPARRVRVRYVKGEGDPGQWANPAPLPRFRTPAPAAGKPRQLRAETERQQPPAPDGTVPYAAPQVSDVRLANGIRLIAARTGDVPLATMTVLIGAGSANDPRPRAGLAGLTAALANEGTAVRSGEQIAAALERLGASLSSSATVDGTYMTVTAPAATLGEASGILADVVRNASFPQADVDRERKRALDGLSVALKTPGQLASMLTAPLIYGAAPYGGIGGGTPQSLAGLTRADLVQFRQTWWRPELTTLVISGGIDAAAARAIAQAAFGDWTVAGSAPVVPAELAGPPLPARTLVVDLPGSGQAAVLAVARGIARSDRAYYDALLANSVLGGSSTGRLFEEIRVKRALSYGASSSLPAQRDDGTLVASAQTKNESAAEVAAILLQQMQRIAAEPLGASDVANRKTLLAGSYRRSMETSAGFNANVAAALLRGIEPAELLAYPQRVDAVSGAGATAAMARILKPGSISLVIVGDAAKFIGELRKLRPDAEVVAADQLDLATAAAAK